MAGAASCGRLRSRPMTGHVTIRREGVADSVAVEEPLEIRVDGRALAVTMRTPGHDEELAVGFLRGEGLVERAPEVGLSADLAANVVEVAGPLLREPGERRFYTTSSCGVCGKSSLEALAVSPGLVLPEGPLVDAATLGRLPDALREGQKVFERTGGLHAAGLFDPDGSLVVLREDVGRHNAVDKLVGWLVLEGRVPAGERILMVSGRASFEIMQKALAAGIPVVAAVSAPSSLAVALAQEFGMTLAGFVRGDSLNVYAGASRIRLPGRSGRVP